MDSHSRLRCAASTVAFCLALSCLASSAFAETKKRPIDPSSFTLQLVLGIPIAAAGGFVGALAASPLADIQLNIFGGGGECDGWAPGTCHNGEAPLAVGWGIGAAAFGAVGTSLLGKIGYRPHGRWLQSFVGAFGGATASLLLGMIPPDRADTGGIVYLGSSLFLVPLGATLCYHHCPGLDTRVTIAPGHDGNTTVGFSTRF
jgi:hypothetical protein